MDRFNKFIDWILKWETVYGKGGKVLTEHDPDDPGGTTKYGIDKRAHPTVDIPNLTKNEAVKIYNQEWLKELCDLKVYPLGEIYFNCCVNAGQGRADQFLKQSDNDPKQFLQLQANFYKRLGEKPKAKKYLKGWLNRLNDLKKYCNIATPDYV